MPKHATNKSVLKRGWVSDDKNFTVEGETFFCKPCGKQYNFERKSQLDQHRKSGSHAANAAKQEKLRQQMLSEAEAPQPRYVPSSFVNDLVAVMLKEGIPLDKLDKDAPLRKFVERYWAHEAIPCVKTLRTIAARLDGEEEGDQPEG